MANIDLAVQDAKRLSHGHNVTDSGTAVTATDVYFIPNNGQVKLLVNSTPGCIVTVVTPNTVDGLAVTDYTATIGAAKQHVLGPFPPNIYNDSAGKMQVQFSAAANVFVLRG